MYWCEQTAHEAQMLSYKQQDRQCMYNVTLRRVHETIIALEKQ
jgi:hypothetical protein